MTRRYIDQLDVADPRDWTRTPIVILGVRVRDCNCYRCWADVIAETLAGVLFLGIAGALAYLLAGAMGAPA